MITLFNTTNDILSVNTKDKQNKCYIMFIEARRSVNVHPWQITEDIHLKINEGVITVLGVNPFKKPSTEVSSVVVDTIAVETINQDILETPEAVNNDIDDITLEDINEIEEAVEIEESATVEEVVSSKDDSFVCDICGNEFASKRGLDMHKSRSHFHNE